MEQSQSQKPRRVRAKPRLVEVVPGKVSHSLMVRVIFWGRS